MLPQQSRFGGICRETYVCFTELVVNDRWENTLYVISRRINPGSTVVSDCWKWYTNLSKTVYGHQTVSHIYNVVDAKTLASTQKIERLGGNCQTGQQTKNIH